VSELWNLFLAPGRGRGLPPGQRELGSFPRFTDKPKRPPPEVPAAPTLTIGGAVEEEIEIGVDELRSLVEPQKLTADLHCVTTWSVRALRWEGIAFADLWADVIVPRCRPAAGVAGLAVRGLDRTQSVIHLDDALEPDVLLADRLDGEPLTPAHGAPLRFVSPGQYGYKNVKHLTRIDLWVDPPPGAFGPKEHPRARVALEERHSTMNGRLLRLPYRLAVAPVAWVAHRATRPER
jgi:DMSO/TMAO reductase YedYZ molybdopterin-dependent catalytic subunit